MVPIEPNTLVAAAERILVAAGAAPANAHTVATSLVESDLVGHDSHGVRRLVPYLEAIRDGRLDPVVEPTLDRPRSAASVVDGRRGFGQVAARLAVTEARRLARERGAGVVAIRRCNHVGRLGEYVEALAEGDTVGLAFGNADPTVAPFGGRERRLGTNPFAWAAPRARGRPPVVADFATAAIAEGKVALASAAGEQVAPGLVVGPDGHATTDPADFYRGGALLPFGQHKGYGLSVLIEIVGGLLTGAGVSSLPGYDNTFGTVVVAVDIGTFAPVDEFRQQCEDFCALLGGTAPADGGRVLVPGELEAAIRAERLRDGIPLSDITWRDLAALPGGPRT
jgi:LDH2 family malate/lactate/ureidoglycolate dehydrogenase